ncbi:MAG: T9SS type A sorting domain-containing protein [Bacteroidota bacterium]
MNYTGEDHRTAALYNSVGQQIQTIHLYTGTNRFGRRLSSGMYFLQVDGRSFKLLKE